MREDVGDMVRAAAEGWSEGVGASDEGSAAFESELATPCRGAVGPVEAVSVSVSVFVSESVSAAAAGVEVGLVIGGRARRDDDAPVPIPVPASLL